MVHSEKIAKQPHASGYPYLNSPRCGAKTRKGTPCLSPSVNGKKRCRMHGGAKGSGAKPGNKNALKHGAYSKEMLAFHRSIKQAIKDSKQMLNIVLIK
jgi:uncharacterized protein YjcR